MAADSSRHHLELIQAHIQAVTRELEMAQGKRGHLEAELRRSEEAIGRAADDLRQTQKQLAHQKARLQTLEESESQQQGHLKKQIDALSAQVVSAYKTGQQPRLQLLLSQKDPARISRMLTYYDYLNRARLKEIAEAKQSLAGLIQTQESLKTETHALSVTLVQQRQHHAALNQAEDQRLQALSRIDQTISNRKARLNTLRQNAKRLQDVLNTLGHAVGNDVSIDTLNHTPFDRLAGRLRWPVTGSIEDRFGESRNGSDGVLRWQGTFIKAAIGTPIHAVDAGRVVFADWLRGYGLLLIVDHGKGFMTLYGHDQAIYRSVGSLVRPGEVVASVGNSGGEQTSGVYFAIRHDGHPLDPEHWCNGKP